MSLASRRVCSRARYAKGVPRGSSISAPARSGKSAGWRTHKVQVQPRLVQLPYNPTELHAQFLRNVGTPPAANRSDELPVDEVGAAKLSIDGGSAVLTRTGFVSNGAFAIGDQTNDPGIDGALRIRPVVRLCRRRCHVRTDTLSSANPTSALGRGQAGGFARGPRSMPRPGAARADRGHGSIPQMSTRQLGFRLERETES